MKSFQYDIFENQFKTDCEGQIIFFPKGLSKPGYIVPDIEKKNEIIKIHSNYCNSIAGLLCTSYIADFTVLNIIIITCVFLLITHSFNIKLKKITDNLIITHIKPDFDEYIYRKGVRSACFLIALIPIVGMTMPAIVKKFGFKGIILSISTLILIIIISIITMYNSVNKNK